MSATNTTTRILLVEDSEDDAALLQAVLGKALPGLEMLRVDNAEDMQAALAHEWDVVISDHVMPRFDAFRAFKVLQASGRELPFIIHSGAIEQDHGVRAMHIGVDDFVDKGNYGRLVPVVQRALRHVANRRALDAAEDSVERLENGDPLTGLPNRKRFVELATELLEAGGERGAALFYLDIDRFMRINDSFGYATGDTLLRLVAERLRRCRGRGYEVLARIGHDEFAVLAEGLQEPEELRARGERIKQCFAESFPINGQSLFLTVSVGAAAAPQDATDAECLLRNAESAMYSAKRQGRNGMQLYQREFNRDTGQRLRLESALRHAVSRGELYVVYQPIIDAASGVICATEGLVRWRHPEFGMVPPDQFIPIADETGLILEIGDWVLRASATQTRRWHDAGWKDLGIAVNFSAAQFKRQDIDESVRRALADCGLAPHWLELEITETLAMQNAEATAATLRRLKEMGVRVSIDDFGTGYSSLGYLRRFPLDILKVDRSFVRDADRDADSAAIVRTVVALARSLKLTVHAEGVETAEHDAFLLREGVDRMQGYFFGKPCDPQALEAMLARRNTPRLQAVA